jgi:hypothetical protein
LLTLIYLFPFIYALPFSDGIRDLQVASDIARGISYPLLGPVFGNRFHAGPAGYYLEALPLWFGLSLSTVPLFLGVLASSKFLLAYGFGKNVSPNGLPEYVGKQFDGLLDGTILVTRYSGGKDIIVLRPGPDGKISEAITGIDGFTGFSDPLDLTEDETTGNLYVAEYGGRQLTLLKPKPGTTSQHVFKQEVKP